MRILNFMLETLEYLQDYLVRMTHNSTAIEGNTLTQEQVASILLEGLIVGNMLEKEYWEVRNYKKVIPLILENLQKGEKLTPKLIEDIHLLLMENLLENVGEFKKIQNLIAGANFEPTKPVLIPASIHQLCEDLQYQLQNATSQDEKLKIILKTHFDFERMHPFSDGRVGRLLVFYSCLQEDIIPPIISKEDKELYISFLEEEKLEEFFDLILQIQEAEKEKMKAFGQIEFQESAESQVQENTQEVKKSPKKKRKDQSNGGGLFTQEDFE